MPVMTWNDIVSKVIFWTPGAWTLDATANLAEVSPTDQAVIMGYLQNLYNTSPEAALVMTEVINRVGAIRIGNTTDDRPAYFADFTTSGYIGVSLPIIQHEYYINRSGILVQDKADITLIHELIHLTGARDPSSDPGAMNGPAFDYQGATVRRQNVIADEMNYNDRHQVSYDAALLDTDPRFANFAGGISYSRGETVEIVRFGVFSGFLENNDFIDMSLRTDSKTTLLFGFGGGDVIIGGRARTSSTAESTTTPLSVAPEMMKSGAAWIPRPAEPTVRTRYLT
jgi:hypothetical protein